MGGRERGGREGGRREKGIQTPIFCVYVLTNFCTYMFAVDQLALAVKQVTVSHGEERNGERINCVTSLHNIIR